MRDRSPTTLWESTLGQLELQVTRPNFETWLRNTQAIDLHGDELIVGVPNDFAIEWLKSRMNGLVNRTVSQIAGRPVSVAYQVLGSTLPAPATGRAHAAISAPRPQLDARLTLEAFVVLKTNRPAYRAARRAADGNTDCNPLVLFGPPGLGKTHLLHAIGHRAAQAGHHVALLTGEAFVSQYVAAVRRGEPASFRSRFDGCDVLLLDDLQFLCSKTSSQQQFFHIFDALHSAGHLVVLTADAAPADLPGLTPRLRSRIAAGLAVEIHGLTAADRIDILRAKAPNLAPAVVQLVADQPYASMRELDGALHRLAATADSAAVSTADAKRALSTPAGLDQRPAPLTAAVVLETVCRYFHLSPDQVTGQSRARDVTYARHIAMYLIRERCSLPLAQIGALLGGRDHSTVLSGHQRIEGELSTFPQTKAALQEISGILEAAS